MPHTAEDFDNLRPIVSNLDAIQETGCGSFESTRPIPGEILAINFGLGAQFNRFARENYQAGDYKKALRGYTLHLKLLWIWIQQTEFQPNGRFKFELEQFLSSAYYNRGNTYDELGEYDKAIKDYNCALDLPNPEPWNDLLNRGLVYEKLGQLDNAERDVREACQRAPGHMQNIERALDRIRSKRHKGKAQPGWKRLFGM